jgi:hypothetical protein
MPLWQWSGLRIGDPVKSMSKSDTEPAIVDRATNLGQQIGAISWALVQSHLIANQHLFPAIRSKYYVASPYRRHGRADCPASEGA